MTTFDSKEPLILKPNRSDAVMTMLVSALITAFLGCVALNTEDKLAIFPGIFMAILTVVLLFSCMPGRGVIEIKEHGFFISNPMFGTIKFYKWSEIESFAPYYLPISPSRYSSRRPMLSLFLKNAPSKPILLSSQTYYGFTTGEILD